GEQARRAGARADPGDADDVAPALPPVHRRAPQAGEPQPPAPVRGPALQPDHARTLLESRAALFKGRGPRARFSWVRLTPRRAGGTRPRRARRRRGGRGFGRVPPSPPGSRRLRGAPGASWPDA